MAFSLAYIGPEVALTGCPNTIKAETTLMPEGMFVSGAETSGTLPQPERRMVFLSFSREDGYEFAKELADHLTYHGFSPWLDQNILPGEEYDSTIEDAIRESEFMMVVVTESVDLPDSFVRREIQYANDIGKRIVPIKLSGSAGPILLKRRQWLTAEQSLGPNISELLKAEPSARLTLILSKSRKKKLYITACSTFIAITAIGFVGMLPALSLIREEASKDLEAHFSTEVVAQHIELLNVRAAFISNYLNKEGQLDAQREFERMHSENVSALALGRLTVSHEITGKIRELLNPFTNSSYIVYRPPIDDPTWRMPWSPETGKPLSDSYVYFGDGVGYRCPCDRTKGRDLLPVPRPAM